MPEPVTPEELQLATRMQSDKLVYFGVDLGTRSTVGMIMSKPEPPEARSWFSNSSLVPYSVSAGLMPVFFSKSASSSGPI